MDGCGWAAIKSQGNEQIAPIIYQNCSMCHRPGEAAPFSLLSYHDVVRKAKTIAKATGAGAIVVQANQGGDSNWGAAPAVNQTITPKWTVTLNGNTGGTVAGAGIYANNASVP